MRKKWILFNLAFCATIGCTPKKATTVGQGPSTLKAQPQASATPSPVASPSPTPGPTCIADQKLINNVCVNTVEIFRYYSASRKTHHLAPASENVPAAGFSNDGSIMLSIPDDAQAAAAGASKFYRLLDPASMAHFFTVDTAAVSRATSAGFRLEGYYQCFVQELAGITTPLHLWSYEDSRTRDYLYSISAGPNCQGQSNCGGELIGKFTYMGIACHVIKAKP